jgi:hypothetical protein
LLHFLRKSGKRKSIPKSALYQSTVDTFMEERKKPRARTPQKKPHNICEGFYLPTPRGESGFGSHCRITLCGHDQGYIAVGTFFHAVYGFYSKPVHGDLAQVYDFGFAL